MMGNVEHNELKSTRLRWDSVAKTLLGHIGALMDSHPISWGHPSHTQHPVRTGSPRCAAALRQKICKNLGPKRRCCSLVTFYMFVGFPTSDFVLQTFPF